jgi:hypothetical protein
MKKSLICLIILFFVNLILTDTLIKVVSHRFKKSNPIILELLENQKVELLALRINVQTSLINTFNKDTNNKIRIVNTYNNKDSKNISRFQKQSMLESWSKLIPICYKIIPALFLASGILLLLFFFLVFKNVIVMSIQKRKHIHTSSNNNHSDLPQSYKEIINSNNSNDDKLPAYSELVEIQHLT